MNLDCSLQEIIVHSSYAVKSGLNINMDFTVFFLVFQSSINNLGHAYKWQNVLVCAYWNFFPLSR